MPLKTGIYPPWWTADITLYNRDIAADGTVSWYKTLLGGCYFTNATATSTSLAAASDKAESDTSICRIRESESYRNPVEWSALDEAGKTSYFTLYPEDIIVPGHVSDEIDETGESGLLSSALLEKHDRMGAFRVSEVSECTGHMVGSPHYKALGVV